jgi:hypothetical protein
LDEGKTGERLFVGMLESEVGAKVDWKHGSGRRWLYHYYEFFMRWAGMIPQPWKSIEKR